MLPHFRYLQDVVRYVNTLERQVDDTLNRTKDMRLLGNLLPRTYRPSVDQAVHAYRPKITQSMLARASTIGIENLQIVAAFETFVITQKSDKAKKKKIDINQKVVVPNAKKLADQYALAEDLHEKYVTLQNVEAQITMQFRDSRDLPKVLKSVKSAKAKVEKALRLPDGDILAPRDVRATVRVVLVVLHGVHAAGRGKLPLQLDGPLISVAITRHGDAVCRALDRRKAAYACPVRAPVVVLGDLRQRSQGCPCVNAHHSIERCVASIENNTSTCGCRP